MDFIIWLIIAVFWIIANISQANKKRKGQPPQRPRPQHPYEQQVPSDDDFRPPHRRRPQEEPDDEPTFAGSLKEVLEKLGAPVDHFPDEPEVEQKQPAPAPAPAPPRHAPLRRHKPLQRPSMKRTMPKTLAFDRKAADISNMDTKMRKARRSALQDVMDKTPAAFRKETTRKHFTDTHSMITPRSVMIGINGLNMPILNVPLVTPHTKHHGSVELNFKGSRRLKQAIAYGLVLGPPKALQEKTEDF